jgi:Ankyrin repeats (3 copies)/Ankyrin repeat
MKSTILSIAILLAFEAFAQAGDPLPTMVDVIYGLSVNAAKFKRLEQLKELIKQGADVNAPIGFNRMLNEREDPSSSSRTATAWPLDLAVQQAQVDMVKLLLANGAKFHGGELAKAAFAGNQEESLAMVTALLEAGADVNSPHPDYRDTALIWHSYKGNKSSAVLLLAQPGIKLDVTNIDGDTALMVAAEQGHAEIVEMLLKAGANVSITDKRGETAISLAQKALAKQQAIVEKQQAMLSKLQSHPK